MSKSRVRPMGVVLAVAVALLMAATPVAARPQDLDQSFSQDGKRFVDFESGAFALSVLQQEDGRIVVAGYTQPTGSGGEGYFALARLHPDGQLDRSFGERGRLVADPTRRFDDPRKAALQPDGKIITLANYYADDGSFSGFTLMRSRPDGSPDGHFAGDGSLRGRSPAADVIVQSDGMVVVLLVRDNGSTALVRYDRDGSLDRGFGQAGRLAGLDPGFSVLAQDSSGRLVVAGVGDLGQDRRSVIVARYLPDGRTDPSFGRDGSVSRPQGRNEGLEPAQVLIDGRGRLIVAGTYEDNVRFRFDFAVLCLRPDGHLDRSCGDGDGLVRTRFYRYSRARAAALTPDGGFVVAGHTANTLFGDRPDSVIKMAVAAYTPTGQPDRRFSGNGKDRAGLGRLEPRLQPPEGAAAFAVLVQRDGRVVVAGGVPDDFAVIRYRAYQ